MDREKCLYFIQFVKPALLVFPNVGRFSNENICSILNGPTSQLEQGSESVANEQPLFVVTQTKDNNQCPTASVYPFQLTNGSFLQGNTVIKHCNVFSLGIFC